MFLLMNLGSCRAGDTSGALAIKMRYWVANTTAHWQFARDACRGRGSDLASIPNAQAAATIASLVQAQLGSAATDGVWIGASDLNVEGSFRWSDGSPWSYSNLVHAAQQCCR
jgi:hypothetical protein